MIYPYENIFGLDRSNLRRKADKVMSAGWSAKFFQIALPDEDRWSFGDSKDRSLNYHAHGWAMMDVPLAAYCQNGETRYLSASLDIALDWISRFSSKDVMGEPIGVTHMAWYDMAVGLRAYRLAYLIDAVSEEGLADDELRAALWHSLLLHADYLADDSNIRFHNNHGFYQAAGQLAMGRRFEKQSPVMRQAHVQGDARFSEMLHRQFSTEGVHLEHSPDYHRMVYRTARSMAQTGLIESAETLAFLDEVERALAWFVLPSGHIANIGDSDSHALHDKPGLARAEWHTEEMRWIISNGLTGKAPSSEVALFPEAGYVAARILRAGDPDPSHASFMLQQAGFHSRTHKHADTLSFIWSDRGQRILVDAGRFGYVGKTAIGSDLHRAGFWYSDPNRIYCESTRAHNCLEFDGRDYPRKSAPPFGSAVERYASHAEGQVHAFESCATHFDTIRHVRLIFVRGDDWLVCLDLYEDDRQTVHDVAQWFHFSPAIKTSPMTETGFSASLSKDAGSLQIRALLPDVDSVDHERGAVEPRLQGWWSRGFRKIEPNDAICFRQVQRSSGMMATLFQFGEDVRADFQSSGIEGNGHRGRLEWTSDGDRHQLVFERVPGTPMTVHYSRNERPD